MRDSLAALLSIPRDAFRGIGLVLIAREDVHANRARADVKHELDWFRSTPADGAAVFDPAAPAADRAEPNASSVTHALGMPEHNPPGRGSHA